MVESDNPITIPTVRGNGNGDRLSLHRLQPCPARPGRRGGQADQVSAMSRSAADPGDIRRAPCGSHAFAPAARGWCRADVAVENPGWQRIRPGPPKRHGPLVGRRPHHGSMRIVGRTGAALAMGDRSLSSTDGSRHASTASSAGWHGADVSGHGRSCCPRVDSACIGVALAGSSNRRDAVSAVPKQVGECDAKLPISHLSSHVAD